MQDNKITVVCSEIRSHWTYNVLYTLVLWLTAKLFVLNPNNSVKGSVLCLWNILNLFFWSELLVLQGERVGSD